MKKYVAGLITVIMTLLLCGSVLAGENAAEQAAAEEVTMEQTGEIAAAEQADAGEFTDGAYMIDVAMEGGSGRATIQSPCEIVIKAGEVTATIIWSSENYDYMIVAEEHIDPIRTEGGSTFEIPVADLNEPLTVIGDTVAMSQPHEIEYTLTFDPASMKPAAAELEDGIYSAEFTTDSTMFKINEAMEGKGILTVKDGEMTIHITLPSKNIVNLFPGLAEDAQKEGAELLEPTEDPVTYSDGYSETVNGFDVPVPVLDEEFDLALIGKKEVWYDHKVKVSNPQPLEEVPAEADKEE